MKSAVIYYSRGGATKGVAEKLSRAFGAELYAVEPEKAYGGYLSAVLRNGGELLQKRSPKVITPAADCSGYDVVFVGFPVWYGTMPNFMQEYVKACGIHSKRVIPFATAGANGRESSLKTVRELFPDCTVSDYFYTTKPAGPETDAWISALKQKLGASGNA